LRTARIQRKAGRPEAALETYQRLAGETAANKRLSSTGSPYGLLAANARGRILIELGRREQASGEARPLHAGLLPGRWPLSREVLVNTWTDLDGLGTAAGEPPKSAADFATLVSRLYARWQSAIGADASAGGREPQPDLSLLVWHASGEHLT